MPRSSNDDYMDYYGGSGPSGGPGGSAGSVGQGGLGGSHGSGGRSAGSGRSSGGYGGSGGSDYGNQDAGGRSFNDSPFSGSGVSDYGGDGGSSYGQHGAGNVSAAGGGNRGGRTDPGNDGGYFAGQGPSAGAVGQGGLGGSVGRGLGGSRSGFSSGLGGNIGRGLGSRSTYGQSEAGGLAVSNSVGRGLGRGRGLAALVPNGLIDTAEKASNNIAELTWASWATPKNMNENVLTSVRDLVDRVGKSVRVTSGWRSRNHSSERNKRTPGAHNRGTALDLDLSKMTDAEKTSFLVGLSEKGFKGFITYGSMPDIVHVDMGLPHRPDTHHMHNRSARHFGSAPDWHKAAKEQIAAGIPSGLNAPREDIEPGAMRTGPAIPSAAPRTPLEDIDPGNMVSGPAVPTPAPRQELGEPPRNPDYQQSMPTVPRNPDYAEPRDLGTSTELEKSTFEETYLEPAATAPPTNAPTPRQRGDTTIRDVPLPDQYGDYPRDKDPWAGARERDIGFADGPVGDPWDGLREVTEAQPTNEVEQRLKSIGGRLISGTIDTGLAMIPGVGIVNLATKMVSGLTIGEAIASGAFDEVEDWANQLEGSDSDSIISPERNTERGDPADAPDTVEDFVQTYLGGQSNPTPALRWGRRAA